MAMMGLVAQAKIKTSFAAKDFCQPLMKEKMTTKNPEVQQVKKLLLAIVLLVVLATLDHYGVPFWFAGPALGMSCVGIMYVVLKRREAKQKVEAQS